MNPRAIIAEVAEEYLGTRETSKNRGPHLERFWSATTYKDGDDDRQPWCSAFVSFCVKEADRRSPKLNLRKPPAFAGVAQWVPWALEPGQGCLVFRQSEVTESLSPMAGDIVTFLPQLSHIGIVAKDYDGKGIVHTIEGNTNQSGSREGDGVYRKARILHDCGTFIRIPAIATKA